MLIQSKLEYPKPFHNGEKWVYDKSPIYKNLLDCFHESQRPIDSFKKNSRLRDPFRKVNKMSIQYYLGHKQSFKYVDWVEDRDGIVRAGIIYNNIGQMKSKTKKIKSFTGKEYILSESDSYIAEIACYPGYEELLVGLIRKHEAKGNFFSSGTTVIEIDMQLKRMRELLKSLGYVRKDNLISSFADMYGYWFKDKDNIYKGIDLSQEISLQKLECEVQDTKPLMKQILELQIKFANHYSNYNKGNTWSGAVVRGYGGREDFIIKPSEMSGKWKKENSEKLKWGVQDTPLRKYLTEVEKFCKLLPYKHERIRILKLSQGEGELERHTDIQDKEAGIGDGQWARLHFPLQTNPKVEFAQWNTDGSKTICKMREGELWYLDMRKPHTAVNFGEQDRYHLIIDIKSDETIRDWLVESSKKYPSEKKLDNYIEK